MTKDKVLKIYAMYTNTRVSVNIISTIFLNNAVIKVSWIRLDVTDISIRTVVKKPMVPLRIFEDTLELLIPKRLPTTHPNNSLYLFIHFYDYALTVFIYIFLFGRFTRFLPSNLNLGRTLKMNICDNVLMRLSFVVQVKYYTTENHVWESANLYSYLVRSRYKY